MSEMAIDGIRLVLTNPWIIAIIFGGTLIGIIFGAIPGLSATMAITIFLPVTYSMQPVEAICLLMALYIGGISGGLISAIMLNIPGTSSSVATCFDGSPMARQGRAGEALSIAVWSSLFGTLFGIAALWVIAPQLARIAIKLGPYEYCALAILSLSLVIALTGKDTAKGLISAILGILFATVGLAPVDAAKRYTFGFFQLNSGLALLVVLIGMFAISEILGIAEKTRVPNHAAVRRENIRVKGLGFTLAGVKRQLKNLLRSALIGTGIGILPGVGGGVSCMVAYAAEKSSSKNPDSYGKGNPGGVVASEAANNATIGGAMIPLLTLGIPGDTPAAMLLGALMIQGVSPGPLIFAKSGNIVYAIFCAMVVSAVFMTLIESIGVNIFTKLLEIPNCYLMPIVIVLCCVGGFGSSNRMFDVWCILFFGLLGYAMLKGGFPIPPFVLGFILGPIFETNFRRMVQMMQGEVWTASILEHPIAIILLVLAIALTVYFIRKNKRGEKSILVEEQ